MGLRVPEDVERIGLDISEHGPSFGVPCMMACVAREGRGRRERRGVLLAVKGRVAVRSEGA
eukprot:2930745-Rhodomonas_salina.1